MCITFRKTHPKLTASVVPCFVIPTQNVVASNNSDLLFLAILSLGGLSACYIWAPENCSQLEAGSSWDNWDGWQIFLWGLSLSKVGWASSVKTKVCQETLHPKARYLLISCWQKQVTWPSLVLIWVCKCVWMVIGVIHWGCC